MLTSTNPSQTFRAEAAVDDISRWVPALSCWLIGGVAALICVPELRGTDPLFGWLPFWLIIAPAIDLAVLRRRSLVAHAQQLITHISRRRRPTRQARPSPRRSRTTRHAQPLARKARTRAAVS